MKHSYRRIVAYNPAQNIITAMEVFSPDKIFLDSVFQKGFRDVYAKADVANDMIIGVGVARELYQLSPASYSNYIKEDTDTMKFIDRNKFFRAVDVYHQKNNIPYPDY